MRNKRTTDSSLTNVRNKNERQNLGIKIEIKSYESQEIRIKIERESKIRAIGKKNDIRMNERQKRTN